MFVVAVHDMGEDTGRQAEALSLALGKTLMEARARLNAPGRGPFVVGLFGKEDQAHALSVKLNTGGFHAVVLAEEDIQREAGGRDIRRFDFGEMELNVKSSGGESVTTSYSAIDLILRGTAISSSTSTETTRHRAFNVGRAVLSGGLMMTKTTKTVRESTNQEREGFFILYSGDERPLAFRENGLLYDSLGAARKPSRQANFSLLLAEVRRRCPAARYDERLLSRSGQAALLGPSLAPEDHLVIATALLAKVLRGKTL